jgi:hypothetical protein
MASNPVDIQPYVTEVEAGLPHEQIRLSGARVAQDFYDWEGKKHSELFQREAESPFDFKARTYRASGFTREIVDVLTEHLYCPGPSRIWTDEVGQEFLDSVYRDNHFPALAVDLDRFSTLHDIAAVQIDAGAGDYSDKPITLRVWAGDQFHAWCDPNDSQTVAAVVTIDEFDEQKRFRLWTNAEVRTFVTAKATGTAGGRVATQTNAEPNSYGVIPFAFFHYEFPTRRFWTPGISDLVVDAEIRINDRLSRLDESIHKHLNPILKAKNVPANWQPIIEPGRFLKLNSPIAKALGFDGAGTPSGSEPDLEALELRIDIAGAWDDLKGFISQVLEAARVPASAVRMEQQTAASGISLIVEQAALLSRARRRQMPFHIYEENLAKRILLCAGNHYGQPALTASSKAGTLSVAWPKPTLPVPTADGLALTVGEVQAGLKSHLMAIQEWYGVDREQALEIAAQIEQDQIDLKSAAPSLAAQPVEASLPPPAQAEPNAPIEPDQPQNEVIS